MDRKTIIVLVACLALLLVGQQLINKLYPPLPAPPPGTNVVASAFVAATNGSATAVLSPAGTNRPVVQIKPVLPLAGPEATLTLTNADARYIFTSRGGGLRTIELVEYPETITRKKKKAEEQDFATLNTPHAAPVLAVFGDHSVQDDAQFALTPTTTGVRAEKTLTNGLRLVKDFQLGTNHLFHARVRLENTSDGPLILSDQEWVIGTATPTDPDDHAGTHGAIWYDGNKTEEKAASWFVNSGFLFWGGTPRPEFRAGQSNVVWAAAQNQFFVLAAMLPSPAQQVVAHALDLPRPTEGYYSYTSHPAPQGYQTALVYPGMTLAAGQALEREVHFYAGPKEYRTLSRIADRFKNNVDYVMGFNGFFGFFSKALLLGMNWVHSAFSLPYGWCIIAITVIIKAVFWPLTAMSTRSAKRMQELGPQMNALKEKYKDDPQKFSAKQFEFWKQNGVNPMSGCLPMLVQLPVFFGLYGMIRTAIELRGAHFLWAVDLSRPDTLFIIPGLGFLPFIGTPEGLPFNLLPIVYIATALWQSHLTPASPGMDPAQQRLMRWMPLMFLAILYNFSSGLALYMTTNNLLTILQTKLTKTAAPGTPAAPQPTALTPASKKKK